MSRPTLLMILVLIVLIIGVFFLSQYLGIWINVITLATGLFLWSLAISLAKHLGVEV